MKNRPMDSNHRTTQWLALVALLLTINAQVSTAQAQGTAFTYQGRLDAGGNPTSGTYDLQFAIYDSTNSPGNLIAGPVAAVATTVSNGLFTVTLDFGSGVFTGASRWLDIAVRTTGAGSYTALSPRQPLTPAPYAVMANTASNLLGTLPVSQLNGTPDTAVDFSGNLAGDVTGTQGATVVSSVGGQTAANVASGASAANAATSANTASSIDKRDTSGNFSAGTITASLSGNATTATSANSAASFSGSLSGDVTGTQGATTVAKVGGVTAANVASGANAANGATYVNAINTIVKRDASGNFSAGTITASLSGNASTATSASSAANFSGSLSGDVTGTQSATVVSAVGGVSAANVASGANAANAATSTNLPSTIVKRDANGSFSATNLTLSGNLYLPPTTNGAGVIYYGVSGFTLMQSYGNENFFAGPGSGNLGLTGSFNAGCGADALGQLTSGVNNTGCGHMALYYTSSGCDNAACGYNSLLQNVSGSYNTTVGSITMYNSGSVSNNTAIGYMAMINNNANYNTAVGSAALPGSYANPSFLGGHNIALGYKAGWNTGGSNNIIIGDMGSSTDNNTIRIGTQGIQTSMLIAGIYGITTSGGVAVYVNSNGQLGTQPSSARFKRDIQNMDEASDALLSLRPVTFRYKTDIDSKALPQFGLVAEEVEKVNPDLVIHDDAGKPYTVRYEAVNAMLLNEFLKERRKVEQLESRLERLEQLLSAKRGGNL